MCTSALGWPVAFPARTTYRSGSLTGTVLRSRTALNGATDLSHPVGLLLDSTRVNGRLFVDSLDFAARRSAQTSAIGRRAVSSFDARGQTLASQAWARLGQTFT